MNQELARKQPATVVRQGPIPRGQVRRSLTLAAPTQQELREALDRRSRAGEVELAWDWRKLTSGPRAGYWAVDLVLVPPRKDPRWARWCLRAGFVLLGLAAFLGSLAWLLSSVTPEALLAFVVLVLASLVTWLKVKYPRNNVVTITTTVHMR